MENNPNIIHVLPDSPSSVLSLFGGSTQQAIDLIIDTISTEVEQGGRNPLEADTQAAVLEKIGKGIRERVKEKAKQEAEKYPEKEIDIYGVKVVKGNVSTTYDYSHDKEWKRLSSELKAREAFLKALPKPMDELDKDTGEIITIIPAIKKQVDGFKVNFK